MEKIEILFFEFAAGAVVLIIALFVVALLLGASWVMSLAILFGLIIAVFAVTIQKSWIQVPHMYEYIVEVLGEYIGSPLESGLHLIFPWFGLCRIKSRVSTSEQMLELHLSNKEGGDGDIEFTDCSSSISAFFYFKVTDSTKVTYAPQDVVKFIREKIEGSLRSFLGNYSIDDAIRLKNKFTIEAILNNVNFKLDPNFDVSDFDVSETEFYKDLDRWGVEPTGFTISDIDLPESIKIQRERELTAEKDLQVKRIEAKQTLVEKKITIIKAEAEKQARILAGEAESEFNVLQGAGMAQKISDLISKGIPDADIASLIAAEMKWQAVKESKNTDKTVILDSNDSIKSGVDFGAGFKSSNENKGGGE